MHTAPIAVMVASGRPETAFKSAEVAALEADEQDRNEMLAVAGLMESLRVTR